MSKQSIATISNDQLNTVCGGDNTPAHYNGSDVANGIRGAVAGSRGGPIGAVVGFGAGFMSRNVGELFNAGRDYFREVQRGRQLEQQRQQMLNRR